MNLWQIANELAIAASNTIVIETDGEPAWLAWDAAVRELEMKK